MEFLWNLFAAVLRPEIVQNLWSPVAKQVGYLRNIDENVGVLIREARTMSRKRKDIEGAEEGPTRKMRRLSNEADDWVKKARQVEMKVDLIKQEFEQRGTGLCRYITNCWSRLLLSKSAVEMLAEVNNLSEKAPFERAYANPSLLRVVEVPTTSSECQSTFERTMEEIWQCLHDVETGIICVWGMGGVGKTSLMKSINNKLLGTCTFDIVIWVTVSSKLNVLRIQKEIGTKLGLHFNDNENEESRCTKLFATLKSMQYLLILDDLWKEVSLERIGIPNPNRDNKCKITFTTRYLKVGNAMGANAKIRVNTLTVTEGWELFHQKAGDVVLAPHICSIARDVVKECGGVPLALIVVGAAMRDKSQKELWEDALRTLARSTAELEGWMIFKRMHNYLILMVDIIADALLLLKELSKYWSIGA